MGFLDNIISYKEVPRRGMFYNATHVDNLRLDSRVLRNKLSNAFVYESHESAAGECMRTRVIHNSEPE